MSKQEVKRQNVTKSPKTLQQPHGDPDVYGEVRCLYSLMFDSPLKMSADSFHTTKTRAKVLGFQNALQHYFFF